VPGRHAIVIRTDGRDEDNPGTGPGSQHTWTEVLQKLQQTEAIVYPVGLGSRVDRVRLETLANESGGSAFFPADVNELAGDYQRILDELRRRYAVAYESSNRARNGRWRDVKISVRQSGATVRSRGGYYAPTQ